MNEAVHHFTTTRTALITPADTARAIASQQPVNSSSIAQKQKPKAVQNNHLSPTTTTTSYTYMDSGWLDCSARKPFLNVNSSGQ